MKDSRAEAERGIGAVYWWLFYSPLITVPWLMVAVTFQGLSTSGDANWSVPVLSAALPHVVLLFGLRSKYLYQRRHVQQALLFVLVRTVTTFLLVAVNQGAFACLWLIVNGGLWLWSSWWGLQQVRKGDCWLMQILGEDSQLPRPWAGQTLESATPSSMDAVIATRAQAALQAKLDRGRALANSGQRPEAVACFMDVFHGSAPGLRQQALVQLEALGEVETF